MNSLGIPQHDPTSIFEHFRGSHGSELLTAAVAHFELFRILSQTSLGEADLQNRLGLERRPFIVLITAMKAMGLVEMNESRQLQPSPVAREHLVPGRSFYVGDYVGLASNSPGVVQMVERLRTNRPTNAEKADTGAAFIFREGIESAMDSELSARRLTLALAGRAMNVAPVMADRLTFGDETLLDVGGGTGIYSIACLQRHPDLKAIVFDRPEVLKVAREFAARFEVEDRIEFVAGDMFSDPLPRADAVLLSNVLHDWDVPQCRRLVRRCYEVLSPGGRILIHDVFLNDHLDGPLPIALYSASLFSLTEGRAYSGQEYREWLHELNMSTSEIVPTLIHCGVLAGKKELEH